MQEADKTFFNAHHAPIGAFATFTLGYPGAKGGLGLELDRPADQNLFIGLQSKDDRALFEALPFYSGIKAESDALRYEGEPAEHGILEQPSTIKVNVVSYPNSTIRREFGLCTDEWSAGDLTFTVYSPARSVPDPSLSTDDELAFTLVPAVLVEIRIDNRESANPRRAYFGYSGSDPYSGMRRLDDVAEGQFSGIGQGRMTAIASSDPGIKSGIAFTLESLLSEENERNLTFGLGTCAAMLMDVPAGSLSTFRFAVCFYKDGWATAGLDTKYYYTRLFTSIEAVAHYALNHFDSLKSAAHCDERLITDSSLSDDQKFLLAQSIRSYYGCTQLLVHNGDPLWTVNEGEYRMINTFDLTVDQLFFEMLLNPWTVRNELDLFASRYAYEDTVCFPGDDTEYPGGVSFTHDMGANNVFSRAHFSSYELYSLRGCFSHMTHEQLVNWLCSAMVYVEKSKDTTWGDANISLFERCFRSLQNRDHPEPGKRNGIMSLDSSRTMGGAEITTYDSLDVSLGQARNNIYLAVKTWASYVGLEKLFAAVGKAGLSLEAGLQARLCASTLERHVTSAGYIPAVLEGDNDSKIIPAIEGLLFPLYTGCAEALEPDGPYRGLLSALKRHLTTILVPGTCLFPDGGWKLSSTANNSWLSKIFLCQFVSREILGVTGIHVTEEADAAHVNWLVNQDNGYWAFSDQMVKGLAIGSRYYPRGVTAVLWLSERTVAAVGTA